MFEERDYQTIARQNVNKAFTLGVRNPLVIAPTGSGKSVIIANHARDAIENWPQTRIICVTHRKELIAQNEAALKRLWPEAPTGVFSAGLGRREHDAQILFCGIQSVYNKLDLIQWVDLIYVDEAHMIPKKATTQYGQFFLGLKAINPHLRIVGFTATPYRLDSGSLSGDPEDGCLFDAIAFAIPVDMLIERGYISTLVSAPVETRLNVDGVARRNGDFVPGQLEAAVNTDENNIPAVDEIIHLGTDRRSWMVFCAGVAHAKAVAAELDRRGVLVKTIFGETPEDERQEIIDAFKAGNIRCIVNVDVLTTGFDAPNVDLIAMLRPTDSMSLYVQVCGRGMRKHPGKGDCMVLDFAGNILRHGPINALRPPKARNKGEGDAPIKICPDCHEAVHAALAFCDVCGFEFPPREIKVDSRASRADILSKHRPSDYSVTHVSYSRHEKPGKPDSLRVSYMCGLQRFSEWICLEHEGYARRKAEEWWMRRGDAPAPATVTEALQRTWELARPTEIRVKIEGDFPRVVGAAF